MNWERIILVGIILVVVLASWIYWLIQVPFGPYDDNEDACSTTNPERDHDSN